MTRPTVDRDDRSFPTHPHVRHDPGDLGEAAPEGPVGTFRPGTTVARDR